MSTSIFGPRWRPLSRPRAGEHRQVVVDTTQPPDPPKPSRDRTLRGKARRAARRQDRA